jgi:hypothetical protein
MIKSVSRFLFAPTVSLWKYVLLAFPLALVVSVALFVSARAALIAAGVDVRPLMPPSQSGSLIEIVGAVIFAPAVETLLLIGGVRLLSTVFRPPGIIAASSAVTWGLFHGLFGLLWFFGTAWSFFVFTCGYLAWRRVSFGHGFAAAALPHALINAFVMALVVAGDRA